MEKKVFRLNEICQIKSGKRIPKGMDYVTYQTNHPYIRARDIKSGNILTEELVYIEEKVYEKIKKYIIQKGDIAITVAGSVGDTGYANEIVDGYNLTENAVRLTNFTEAVDSKFLHYILMQKHYYDYMQLIAGAAAQPKLGIYKIKKIRVVLPNVSIQKRIADILTTYDSLIENNNKRIKLLEQMAENLYKEWFVRFRFPEYENTEFENGIPKGWKIEMLSDIADIIMGQSPKSENYNTNCEGLPFHQGVGSYGDFYLIDDIYSTKGNRIAEADSIIFSVRAPVGRINITLNKIILGRGVASINSVKGYNAYLLWLLKNQFQQEDIIGNGSIFTSVTKKELFGFKILMPHDDLIKKFDSIAFGIESQMRKLSLINDNLAKQRDMLLPRLMSGKLEV